MKISGVDRCGRLIQSARLESSDLRHRRRRYCCHPIRHPPPLQPPFRFAFNPLSQSDATRAQANPIRSGRVPILYLFLTLFRPLCLSCPPPSLAPFFSSHRFSFEISTPSLFLSRFHVSLLCPDRSGSYDSGSFRENLSQGKDSLPRGVVIGSPGISTFHFPPCLYPLPHPCRYSRSTSHSRQARNRHVTLESIIGELTRSCGLAVVRRICCRPSRKQIVVVGYFFQCINGASLSRPIRV